MKIGTSVLIPKRASLRPGLACEIASAGVVAAAKARDGQELRSAFAPLAGVLFTGLKEPGFSNRAAVAAALRQALDEVSQRETKVTLVVPDSSVRVLLLDFDTLPPRSEEALPIIRFRLRKLVPFEVDHAPVSYQILPAKDGILRTICVVSPAAVLGEYEAAVREAGYEPGVVLPSTLAALAGVPDDEPALVVNRNGNSVTTAITRSNDLLLYRTLELAEEEDSRRQAEIAAAASGGGSEIQPDSAGFAARSHQPSAPASTHVSILASAPVSDEELRSSVNVAIAYYEDTLQKTPRQLLAAGAGGAQELLRLLGEAPVPVRDLAPAATGSLTAMPPGLLAGVQGALAS